MNTKNIVVLLPVSNCHSFSHPSRCRRFKRETGHGSVRGIIELTDDAGNVAIGTYNERPTDRINRNVNPEIIDLTDPIESVLMPDPEGTVHISPSAEELLAFHKSLWASWRKWVETTEARRSPELIDLTEMDNSSSDSEDYDENPGPIIPPHRRGHSLKCPICYGNLCEASTVMATSCGHLFCKDCITTSINIRAVCPVCCKNLYGEKLTVVFLNCL